MRLASSLKGAIVAIGLALGIATIGGAALAQQPGDKDPSKLPLGEIQPGGRPAQPGAQPGQPRPIQLPPGAQPGQGRPFPPGQAGQPGRPFPGGPPGRGGPRPQPRPEPEPEHKAPHHCPGHGPLDSPHAPNWWQGLIGVNNEAAKFSPPDDHGHFHREDSFLTQLLWRYENDKDECDPKNQPPPFLAAVLNFGLLAFVIYRFGKKPLAEALLARKKAMMQEIDTATNLKDEAEKRLRDYEDKLQNLDETLEQMKADFAAQSEIERKHVLAEAEERRVRMKKDVEFRIEQELKTARQALLIEAVEKAVIAAEEVLKKSVKADDHSRSADEYLDGIGAAWKGDAVATTRSIGGAS